MANRCTDYRPIIGASLLVSCLMSVTLWLQTYNHCELRQRDNHQFCGGESCAMVKCVGSNIRVDVDSKQFGWPVKNYNKPYASRLQVNRLNPLKWHYNKFAHISTIFQLNWIFRLNFVQIRFVSRQNVNWRRWLDSCSNARRFHLPSVTNCPVVCVRYPSSDKLYTQQFVRQNLPVTFVTFAATDELSRR